MSYETVTIPEGRFMALSNTEDAVRRVVKLVAHLDSQWTDNNDATMRIDDIIARIRYALTETTADFLRFDKEEAAERESIAHWQTCTLDPCPRCDGDDE